MTYDEWVESTRPSDSRSSSSKQDEPSPPPAPWLSSKASTEPSVLSSVDVEGGNVGGSSSKVSTAEWLGYDSPPSVDPSPSFSGANMFQKSWWNYYTKSVAINHKFLYGNVFKGIKMVFGGAFTAAVFAETGLYKFGEAYTIFQFGAYSTIFLSPLLGIGIKTVAIAAAWEFGIIVGSAGAATASYFDIYGFGE